MLKTLYQKCLDLASHKNSNFFLGLVSFIESSFFPIPPDVMIIPMVIAKKKSYLKIFLIASIFSVLGGIFGYILGSIFLDMAMNVIEFYGYENKINALINSLAQGEGLIAWLGILFLAGFTPLPYKVFTIAAGTLNMAFLPFVIGSAIGRGARFYLVAFFVKLFGEKIDYMLKKYMDRIGWSTVFIIIIIASLVYLK